MRLEQWLTRSAERAPDRPAISWNGTTWDYATLESRANRVAHLLVSEGCRPGDRVAFAADKSPEVYALVLGILKAGGVYVPLDPQGPAARMARVLKAAEPRFVIVPPAGLVMAREAAEAAAVPDLRVGLLGKLLRGGEPAAADRDTVVIDDAALGAMPASPPACAGTDADAAHLLFTSGSTGEPKGVIVTHRSVVAFVDWAVAHFGMGPDDRVSGHSPLTFDLSTFDLYGALAAGATLCPVPPATNLIPARLVEFIRRERLTQWFSVPSVLTYLHKFDALPAGAFPALRRLLWCGEVLPTPTLIYLMERLPGVRFTNLYGPTEACIASSHHTVEAIPTDPTAPIPIGTACGGEALHVLDAHMVPCPPGELGDLYIAGAGLSPGYWRDPEKTAAVFLEGAWPGVADARIYRTGDLAARDADGVVHFHGRADTQVKSRGYRIELGEIEAALATIAALREAAVVAVDTGGFEGAALCCAVVAHAPGATPVAELQAALATLVPRYMLPHRWLELDALPRLSNGKVDRPALRRLFQPQPVTAP